MIATRVAGVVEFEATLEWPPGWEGATSVIGLLPAAEAGFRGSLRESASAGLTTVSGELRCLEEEALRAVIEETLRAVASAAALREAVLRTRVLRASRAWCPSATAVQPLARRLWESGLRVGFGPAWSPAAPDVEAVVGCGGDRGRVAEALSASRSAWHMPRVDRIGATG